MNLDDRKLKILQAIIHSYITNAEPVGSRTISKKYDLGVSSATIRNEMSDLEDLGFLVQPYTSAGRVPSDKAYRLYVDSMMKIKSLGAKEKQYIQSSLEKEAGEIDSLIQSAARILSKFTSYTSLVSAPQVSQGRLKHIQLVPIDETKVLLVMVTDSGKVKNAIFRIEKEMTSDQLNKISNLLTEKLKGYTIEEIGVDLEQKIINEMYNLRDTIRIALNSILPLINNSIDAKNEVDLYADGVTNIFNFPEYNDISKAKAFLSFIEDKSSVADMLLRSGLSDIEIRIGDENSYQQIKNCSLITATYKLNGRVIGKIGVIGPTRMNYSKVISIVQTIADGMNDILRKYLIE